MPRTCCSNILGIFTFVIVFVTSNVREASCLRRRRCFDSSTSFAIQDRHRYELSLEYERELRGTPEDLKHVVTVKWNVTGLKDNEYDGFLTRLRIPRSSVAPYEDCEASTSHLWIRTENTSECGNLSQTLFGCHTPLTGNATNCPCDKETCPALAGIDCYGSKLMTDERLYGKYHAIPNTRRSIKYLLDFNTYYSFELYLYYRQHVSYPATRLGISANLFCAEMVSDIHGMDIADADVKCCASNVTSLAPSDFREENLVFDRDTGTLNLTVSWFPPTPSDALVGVISYIAFQNRSDIDVNYPPAVTDAKMKGKFENETRCSRDNRREMLTAYNLLPNTKYRIYFGAHHTGDNRALCHSGRCGFPAVIETDFNPCDKKWSNCNAGFKCISNVVDEERTVPETSCVLDNTSITTAPGQGLCSSELRYCAVYAHCHFDAEKSKTTCSCQEGMVGDGISRAYNGTGCAGCPLISECDENANCVKVASPSSIFTCRCHEDYYGDGLKTGSGCRSKAKRLATIVIPLVILGIVIFILIMWCMCCRNRQKRGRGNNIPL